VGFPGVLFGLTADEAPDVCVKGTEFFLDFEEGASVTDGGVDLRRLRMTPASRSSSRPSFCRSARLWRIESIKYFAIPRALLQDRVPTQSRLRAFQYQELKPCVLVMHGHTPFLVVIGDVSSLCAQAQRALVICCFSFMVFVVPFSPNFSLFLRRRDKPRLLPDKMMRSGI